MEPLTDDEELIDLVAKTKTINPQSLEYFEENYSTIQESHGGEIVAIVGDDVVDSIYAKRQSEEIRNFIDHIRDRYGQEAYITNVPKSNQALML